MNDDGLRCAIVGCGRIASQHIEGLLAAEGTSIAAVCDADLGRARRLAASEHLTETRIFSDYHALLSAVHPDLVTIAIPDAEHPNAVIAAFESGAHVLCEKPLALTLDEAEVMVRAATSHERQNGVRMPYRFTAAYRFAQEWIRQGNLGRPFHIRAHLSVGRLSDPGVPLEWRMRRETGGFGALSDLGSHVIDLSFFLLDEWTARIRSVSGVSKVFYPQRIDPTTGSAARVTAPDAAICTVSFDSGCVLNLEVSRVSPGEHRVQIDGSEGSIRSDGEQVWVYKREKTEHQRPQAQFSPVPSEVLDTFAGNGLFREFVRCCRTPGAQFRPNFTDGRRVVQTTAAIYEGLSKEEGGP